MKKPHGWKTDQLPLVCLLKTEMFGPDSTGVLERQASVPFRETRPAAVGKVAQVASRHIVVRYCDADFPENHAFAKMRREIRGVNCDHAFRIVWISEPDKEWKVVPGFPSFTAFENRCLTSSPGNRTNVVEAIPM